MKILIEFINKYKDKIAKIVPTKHSGIFGALNNGIRLVTGEYTPIQRSQLMERSLMFRLNPIRWVNFLLSIKRNMSYRS